MHVCVDGTCARTVTWAVEDVGQVSAAETGSAPHASQRCQDGPLEGETGFTHIVLRAKERQAMEDVCAHICVHSRAWFHTHTHVQVCFQTPTPHHTHTLCTHMSMCAHVFQCTQVSMCVHTIPVHTRVCAHTPVCAHVYARFLCVHVSTCMFQCTHMCMFSCAYMCVPVYTPMCTHACVVVITLLDVQMWGGDSAVVPRAVRVWLLCTRHRLRGRGCGQTARRLLPAGTLTCFASQSPCLTCRHLALWPGSPTLVAGE